MIDPALLLNLLDPAILFFFFGLFAVLINSNLEIPQPIAKALSLYLLMAIGFKGGLSLAATGVTTTMLLALTGAVIMAVAIPAWSWLILRTRVSRYDAAAIAATYGSVSAVTFIAASALLDGLGETYGGYMTVALVIMESPAIIMAVFLASQARRHMSTLSMAGPQSGPLPQPVGAAVTPPDALRADGSVRLRALLHEAFTDGAHVLFSTLPKTAQFSSASREADFQPGARRAVRWRCR